jgi:hypothetical protein
VEVVDVDQPPGADESSFLIALLTAACGWRNISQAGTGVRNRPRQCCRQV